MTLILSGTDGLSDVDGSAATPAIRGTDANTGIFFPAADTIAFSEGGVEAMRIDSSGNVGIGTASPNASYKMSITGNSASIYSGILFTDTNAGGGVFSIYGESAALKFRDSSAGATRMVIDSSGNVGIGTTPSAWGSSVKAVQLPWGCAIFNIGSGDVAVTQNAYFDNPNFKYASTTGIGSSVYRQIDGTHRWSYAASGTAGNNITFTEAMRIDSSGNLLVGVTSGNYHRFDKNLNGDWCFNIRNFGNSSPYGLYVQYPSASPNGSSSEFIYCGDSTTVRMSVHSNGGIVNYSGNNVNLSDRKEKTNFSPAGNYLTKICAIPVQTFNYIDQNLEEDDGLTLGVVAQDVQAVAPELVMESNWADKDQEPKMRLSIYQTDLQYALMKCIQELKALVDTQASTITQLQADVAALQAPQGTP